MSRASRLGRLLFFYVCLLTWPAPLRAQSAGEIRLEVKDPSGAAMQAAGTLRGLSSGVERAFQTDAQGEAVLASLPYGRYRLEVSAEGFAAYAALIDVQSSSPAERTVTLELMRQGYSVEVIAATPLPGVDLTLREMAAPVQSATGGQIAESGALDLSHFLNRRLNSVYVNEVQGNPFQPDLNYRGYTASPLLGTPQGLSVYMDGMRLNQPFGDVVSWDLIPQLELSGGSFGRGMVEFQHGGAARGFDWFLASHLAFENGWRDNSPSNVRQFFSKLRWQDARTTLGLTSAYANNSLTGNGVQEQRFLDRAYESVYTQPDNTQNKSPLVIVSATRVLTGRVSIAGESYYRYIRTTTFNGDSNEDSLDQSVYQPSAAEQAALTAAGYTGFPASGANASNTPFPFWRCIGQVLLLDEPAEKCNGLLNRTHSGQSNYGLSGQLTWFAAPRGQHNQFTMGAAWDGNTVNFSQSTQLGYLNPDRSITPVNAFGDGVSGGDADGAPFDTRVNLRGVIHTGSVYGTDTLSIGNVWSFTLSGRYNRTSVENTDRITPGGGPGSLDSNSVFDRFNPAAGITLSPWRSRDVNFYASYGEGNRAPTSIELGCADPNQPCKLPNAMAGDPPLDQVVTHTWEFGARGGQEARFSWNIGGFVADNRRDILFVASNQTGFGYFRNFGRTRRQGLELQARSRIGRVVFGGGYTFLDATYRSAETVNGESNSSNDEALEGEPGLEGVIEIAPGDRIPLVPRHMTKAYANIRATSKLSVDLELRAFSGSVARGNENSQHVPDGTYYLGPGSTPAFATASLGARYQFTERVQFFCNVDNLFNRRYYTAAQLGPTGFAANGNFIARPFPAVGGEFPVQQATFYAPGAPIGAWAGMRFKF